LAGFSSHRDITCRHNAVLAIGNLCSNSANHETIVAEGCVKALVTYAFPSQDASVNVQFQAVAGLRGLASHATIRVQLMREKVLVPLMMLATARASDASGLLDNLTSPGDGAVASPLAKNNNKKGGASDAAVATSASGGDSGGSGALTVISSSPSSAASPTSSSSGFTVDAEVQREVAAALCNLAVSEENKVEMVASGVVPALIALTK
jgi:hypothetical protein